MQGKTVNFTKMSGSGNDFIVIDNRNKIVKNGTFFAEKYCHRKFGIGADGLLLVERSRSADFRMVYYNSDGSRASFCGNGARCIAFFSHFKKIAPAKMNFESDAGLISAEVKNNSTVKVKMPKPSGIKTDFVLPVGGRNIAVSFINTGVPHAVIFVSDINNVDIKKLGQAIRYHKKFRPTGTNVDFAKVLGKNKLQIRTYERGVESETLACGTGITASAIISILKKDVSSPVSVLTQGGETLKVYYDFGAAFLEGKVLPVFEGKI